MQPCTVYLFLENAQPPKKTLNLSPLACVMN